MTANTAFAVQCQDVLQVQRVVPAIRMEAHLDTILLMVIDSSGEEAIVRMTVPEAEELRDKLTGMLEVMP